MYIDIYLIRREREREVCEALCDNKAAFVYWFPLEPAVLLILSSPSQSVLTSSYLYCDLLRKYY